MKKVCGDSSGMIRKMADFSLQKVSASISVSKHRSCSSSVSRKAFSLDSAVVIEPPVFLDLKNAVILLPTAC